MRPRSAPSRPQRGIGLIGMVFWAVVLAFVAIVGMKVFPTLSEYFTIVRTVKKIKESGASTVPEVRTAFDQQAQIEYGMNAITGKDLVVDTAGNKLRISFSYEKEVEIMDPVYLLIKYRGEAH